MRYEVFEIFSYIQIRLGRWCDFDDVRCVPLYCKSECRTCCEKSKMEGYMRLSKNFTLDEMIKTKYSAHNYPDEMAIYKMMLLAQYILQPTRDEFGRIMVTSGYRSPIVNAKAGGSPTSQHMKGEAADIVPLDADIDIVFEWMQQHLTFGQLIRESRDGDQWIHVSLPRIGKPNMEVLIYRNGRYETLKGGILL